MWAALRCPHCFAFQKTTANALPLRGSQNVGIKREALESFKFIARRQTVQKQSEFIFKIRLNLIAKFEQILYNKISFGFLRQLL